MLVCDLKFPWIMQILIDLVISLVVQLVNKRSVYLMNIATSCLTVLHTLVYQSNVVYDLTVDMTTISITG